MILSFERVFAGYNIVQHGFCSYDGYIKTMSLLHPSSYENRKNCFYYGIQRFSS